jgi:hypothetical protein
VASHIADYLVVDTYGKQPAIHGFEVKVTRSDWLRELKHPDKSAPWRQYCDYWWLVVADRHIERDDLPDDWGLLVPTAAGSLRASPSAPRNTAVKPMPGTVFAQLARAIAQTAGRETREGLL